MRRSGIRIMGRLIALVTPLLPFMLAAILAGVTGYLCVMLLPVTAVAGGLRHLGLELPPLFTTMRGAALWTGSSGLFLLLFLLAVLRGVLHYLEQECNHYIAFRLLAILRRRVFAALRRLVPAKLEGRDRGELISLITGDIELLEVFYAHTISPIAIAVLSSAIMVALLVSLHPLCGGLLLCGYIVVGALLPLWNSRRGKETGVRCREQVGEMNAFLLDSFRGLWESLQYGQTGQRAEELSRRSDRLSEEQGRLMRLSGDSAAAAGACITLFSFGMLFLCAQLCLRGQLSFPGAVLAVVAAMSSFGPVTALSSLSNNLNQTLACGERVLAILEETPEVGETEGQEQTAFSGAALREVFFAYGEQSSGEEEKRTAAGKEESGAAGELCRGGRTVLRNVSLAVPEGQILGIHGRSGSGKSTLLRLLMRFWDVTRGEVQISGRDIRRVNTANLREMEGFVTQETVLFHDSIAENIAIGKPGAELGEIMEAAKKASLHDFIMTLPRGYNTPVEELGASLSGGERQRLGLARAFLHNAPFLLLDEPTSNLDSLNEGIILRSLKEEGEKRTVVLVSHRSSTLNIADQLYEMEV